VITKVFTIGSAAAIGAYIALTIADREPPVIATEMSAEMPMVKRGETLYVRYKFFRTRSCHTSVARFIFTGDNVRFVVSPLEFPPGVLPLGHDSARVPAPVPETAKPGPATHRALNCYRCNWSHRIWPICAPPRDVHFRITE
jgi:hypothetical protein